MFSPLTLPLSPLGFSVVMLCQLLVGKFSNYASFDKADASLMVEVFEDDDAYLRTYIHTYNIGTYNDHAVNKYEHEHEQRPTIALG